MSQSVSAGKRSASSPKKNAVYRHTYFEMIQLALMTLSERGGSSRIEIWKCIEARFPEANQKMFLVSLKKIMKTGGAVVYGKNTHRYMLEKKFKERALKRQAKGLPLKKVLSTDVTVDKVKKAVKAKKKVAKKPKKQNKKNSKSASKGKGGKTLKAGAKSTKDKIKQKAAANKKTKGSADAKAKVDGKRKTGDKKV